MLSTDEKVNCDAVTVCHEAAAIIDSSPDLFDKLPEDLVDHIVSLMTPKALFSTRNLAKKWLERSPVVHFSIHSDCEFMIRRSLQSFFKQVAERKSVSINLQCLYNESDGFLKEFMSLAKKNNVYEVSIRCPKYKLPLTLFGYKSLLVLRLDGCRVDGFPNVRNERSDSLQVLSFSNAQLWTKFFDYLILICPNISHLSVKQCTGLGPGVIDLSRYKRLKNVQICGTSHGGIYTDAPDLRFLEYISSDISSLIYLGSCMKLEISKSNIKILPRYFRNCPLLQHVHELLAPYDVPFSFSNYVSIWVDPSVDGIQNVPCFKLARSGFKPFSFSLRRKPQWKARFQAEYTVAINTCFFKKLRGLVEPLSQISVVSFRFHGKLQKEAVNIGELRNGCLSPVCRIKHLKLELTSAGPFPLRYSNLLIDSLLFCCYPETLTFKLSKYQNVFIEALREKLKLKEKAWKKCCKVTDVKCWRHFLQDVEIEHTKRTSKRGEEYERVDIRFQWLYL